MILILYLFDWDKCEVARGDANCMEHQRYLALSREGTEKRKRREGVGRHDKTGSLLLYPYAFQWRR